MGLLDSTIRPSTILYDSTWPVYWFNYQMRLGNLFPLCLIIWIFWMGKISLKKVRKWAWNRWILAAFWGCQSHRWMRMASKIQPSNTFMGMYLLICMHAIRWSNLSSWDSQATVAIPKIISVKNARAWVSMISYLKKKIKVIKWKKKSWEWFRICLLNSTANPAQFGWKLAI